MPQRTASAPSAPASNATAAKQPLSLAAVAAAPGDRATESSPHADDSYCALCRRCQMRKKLERRLAAKKEDVESTHATPTPDRDRDQDHSPSTRHDTRSIDELLSFIGDTPGNTISSSTKSAKRARRKRAAATKRRLGIANAQSESAPTEKQPSNSSTYGSDSPVSEDVDFAALHVHDDNARSRTSQPQKGQPEAEHALSSTSRLSEDGDEYYDADEEQIAPPSAACSSACAEMSREQEEAIDREVEEFRRRLESAHCHSHSNNTAVVLHAHAHRPIPHIHATAQPLPKGRRTR